MAVNCIIQSLVTDSSSRSFRRVFKVTVFSIRVNKFVGVIM